MSLRSVAPAWVKRAGRHLVRTWGRYTAERRPLPSVLLAGGQRCGSTSLHRALTAHPMVVGARFHKGVNYFDLEYDRGEQWYRGHFPTEAAARRQVARDAARAGLDPTGAPVVMESSGYYLYHPLALPRIATDLPDVRVIVMLREPVERAHSAYKHAVARGFETESFERALELEPERLAGEEEKLATVPGYRSHAHRHWAYVTRGHYVEQVRRLYATIGPERVYILDAERFFASPEESYAEVLDFLDLPAWFPPAFEQHNARPGAAMSELLRRELTEHFRPYDDELEKLLGRPLAWRR
ncbi:MAG TPA: sulfotransferase [Actinopolymorphaceae bacterium]